jgi:hypothetical protein
MWNIGEQVSGHLPGMIEPLPICVSRLEVSRLR